MCIHIKKMSPSKARVKLPNISELDEGLVKELKEKLPE